MTVKHAQAAARKSAVALLRRLEGLPEPLTRHIRQPYKRLFRTIPEQRDSRGLALEAIEAAKQGKNHIAVSNANIDLGWLTDLGFECLTATKKLPYEAWLLDSLEKSTEELNHRCDHLLNVCPSLRSLDEVDFHHRNPFFSVLQTMWLAKELAHEKDYELVLEKIRSFREVDSESIYSNVSLVQIAVSLFLRIRSLNAEHKEVAWLNSCVPTSMESCNLILWRNEDDQAPHTSGFSPSLLKWYSYTWLRVEEFLNRLISWNSASGLFLANVEVISSGNNQWSLFDDLGSSAEVGRFIPLTSTLAIVDELELAGYSCNLLRQISSRTQFLSDFQVENQSSASKNNGYTIRISWFVRE
jgi:hypothetical protein